MARFVITIENRTAINSTRFELITDTIETCEQLVKALKDVDQLVEELNEQPADASGDYPTARTGSITELANK